MTHNLGSVLFLAGLLLSQAAFAQIGEGTNRRTFSGSDPNSQTSACKSAKDLANIWLESNQSGFGIYSVSTSQSECNCDKGPSRVIKGVCPGGAPICEASRAKDVTVEQPWRCIVDATITKTKK